MIENSEQDCLSYILIPNSLHKLFLAYSKWLCVCLKVNMYITCYIILSFSECFIFFHMSCDLWPYHLMWLAVWQHDLVTNSNLFFFFLNQQFITWCAVADRGSDYVATYMQSKLTLNYKRKEKKRKEKKGKDKKKKNK